MNLEPKDYWAWYQKGAVLEQIKQFKQAIDAYQQVIELDLYSDAWYRQACCYVELNNTNWAIICLEKAIDLKPRKYLEAAVNEPIWEEFRLQKGFQLLITNKSDRYSLTIIG